MHDRRSLLVAAMAMLFAFLAALGTGWQAKTAQETLLLQRDFGFRQLRAYVEVLDASAQPVPTADQLFVTRLQLKNAGMTPAYDLIAYNLIATVRVGEVDTVPLVRRSTWPKATSITLGSQQERTSPQTSQLRVSQAQLDAYAQGVLAFISYGPVNYNDVFGHAHHTEYCSVFIKGREAVTCPQYAKAD